MPASLQSPLSGRVNSGFGGSKLPQKNKIIVGAVLAAIVPFVVSTFAASVTVGNGALEFGQGSQQAVACDPTVYAAISEEWHSQPTPTDSSAGFFRVRGVTISNVDLLSCKGKKLRIRLISTQGVELPIGPTPDANVLQISLPNVDAPITKAVILINTALSFPRWRTTNSKPIAPNAARTGINRSSEALSDFNT